MIIIMLDLLSAGRHGNKLFLKFLFCLPQLCLPPALPLSFLWEWSQQATAAAQNSGWSISGRPEGSLTHVIMKRQGFFS